MNTGITLFGTELRRKRTEAGLSLAGLAALVHYSRSHLSKVETGAKPPSTDLARRCDSILACDGRLAALASPRPAGPAPRPGPEGDDVWVLSLEEDGTSGFRPVSRRQLLAAGGIAGLGLAPRRPGRPPSAPGPAGGPDTMEGFRAIFDRLRGLGQTLGPALLVPTLVAQTHALRSFAEAAGARDRQAGLSLAARYAEYTGWMAQEAGDETRAVWWTDQAVSFAAAAGEHDMAAYALVRRGLIALYRHDAAQTVDLARRAQRATNDRRIRGLAAQREAQGLALAGDYDGCARALDRAARLLDAAAADHGTPAACVGSTNVADPVGAATGWCLFDLGHTARAAEVLRRECARIPDHAHRAGARFGARLSLALAAGGEIEEACAVADGVLDRCAHIDSATIRVDLRALGRELNRWHAKPEVRDIRLRITEQLSTEAL
ncbi:MAG TPA: helix-turn-helix transcriptional regulator [Actinocrinis sp.]|nr:helix-turn-helix transcriptional regulator [Actinocrinis sp.]